MDKRIKNIDIRNDYIIINKQYYILLSDKTKNATVYNIKNNNDIPLYIFNWMRDNHLLK